MGFAPFPPQFPQVNNEGMSGYPKGWALGPSGQRALYVCRGPGSVWVPAGDRARAVAFGDGKVSSNFLVHTRGAVKEGVVPGGAHWLYFKSESQVSV